MQKTEFVNYNEYVRYIIYQLKRNVHKTALPEEEFETTLEHYQTIEMKNPDLYSYILRVLLMDYYRFVCINQRRNQTEENQQFLQLFLEWERFSEVELYCFDHPEFLLKMSECASETDSRFQQFGSFFMEHAHQAILDVGNLPQLIHLCSPYCLDFLNQKDATKTKQKEL